jgi:hypothetical protein
MVRIAVNPNPTAPEKQQIAGRGKMCRQENRDALASRRTMRSVEAYPWHASLGRQRSSSPSVLLSSESGYLHFLEQRYRINSVTANRIRATNTTAPA